MSLLEPTTPTEIARARTLIDSKVRSSLATFIQRTFQTVVPGKPYHDNWHIKAIAWHLEQCLSGDIKRLIITMPPRHLKSICASVAFPAWLLGHEPSKRIICASYSQDLARKHSLDCRTVMEQSWYRRAFPATRLSDRKKTELEFETSAFGSRYATSIGGTLTGRGGDIMIIDDPLKSDEGMSESRRSRVNEWYDGTLYSRLDDKRNGVIEYRVGVPRPSAGREVMAVVQIGEQAGLRGLPAEGLARDEVGRREGPRDQIRVEPEVSRQHHYVLGNAHGGQIQTAANGLGDLAEREASVRNRVPKRGTTGPFSNAKRNTEATSRMCTAHHRFAPSPG